ncbi:ArsR family transcriptional regulator [Thermococcus guaymasensis DSM 11113]|uniref:ArsR family transcriptional regulator n=1 Tax=Thermococcus guaymasensis DSM 11113 TaxID=1432656 RepID=A0A0X1KHX2_9EURY|nr:helix-turn-helix domain-containing protein [Thermococcus guaymasensis]AJC70861.1 ArsR family transcriptional regulator [Thermococcus guaymasensis DSM 11113]
MGEGKIIEINDEAAKLLAQIITNEKALAILHAVEEEPKSLTQIAEELGFPLSTVSYHIDRMLRVGLIEVAGKKYGKKLQEVKLYKASNKPILIVPRKDAPKVTKKLSTLGKLHVISLSVASFFSVIVYEILKRLLASGASSAGQPQNTSLIGFEEASKNITTTTVGRLIPSSAEYVISNMTNSTMSTSSSSLPKNVTSGAHGGNLPLIVAILTFVIVFAVVYFILRRKRF